MSVSVELFGRLGNNLFQYSLARLYAEMHGLHLSTKWNNDQCFKATIPAAGDILPSTGVIINDHNYEEFREIKQQVQFRGHFQKSRWYIPHREQLKTYYDLPPIEPNFSDIVLHIRADDYSRDSIIHPKWYKDILKREDYDRLFIVMSPLDTEFLDQFIDFNPIIVSSSVRDDFLFIRNFKKIICSNSTFCWWAAFLGDPDKVYIFPRWCRSPIAEIADLPNSEQIDGPFLEHYPLDHVF